MKTYHKKYPRASLEFHIPAAGIKKMLAMLVPGGGLVQAAINIYNAITFFMDRAKQIGAFVQNLTSSFASIAKGDIKAAVKTIEAVLGSGLSLALGFLASAAGLTKIASSIKTALDKIQEPAKKILEKIKDWIVKMFSSLVKKVTPGTKPVTGDKAGNKTSVSPTDQQITVPFIMNGVDHTLYITVGSSADIEMASKKDRISSKIGRAVASLLQSGIKEDDPSVVDLKAIGKTASNVQKIVKTLKSTAGVTAASIGYTKLTSQISAYGKKYNVTDIDKSVVSDKTLQGGSRVVTVRGQKWNVPAGKTEKDIPAKDPIGDQLQASATKYGSQWSTDALTENEKDGIKKATEKAKKDGSWWEVNLQKNRAKGRWVEDRVREDSSGLTWSRRGVDVFDIKTNLNYDILLGSSWNINKHAQRMQNIMFRYITF